MKKIGKKTVLLAGGVGGARMAEGLLQVLEPNHLTIIANVGDDEIFYNLLVCPDIDTLLYTLSNRVDRLQGWGIAHDTINALEMLGTLGAPIWMKLGDGDFGLHIWRNWQLSQGETLSEITRACAHQFHIKAQIIPATDDRLQTKLRTDEGWVNFQDWFVKSRCQPRLHEICYSGVEIARAPRAALNALEKADLIIFAPSNPYLSLLPILAIDDYRQAINHCNALKIGISPLIGGKAVKGPLDKIMFDFGKTGALIDIVACYQGFLDGFVIDKSDAAHITALKQTGVNILDTDILIKEPQESRRLSHEIFAFAERMEAAT